MIQIIDGNLLTSNCPVICHQVNCRGVMGAGIAKQIKEIYPLVYERYQSAFKSFSSGNLGKIQPIKCKNRIIINMFAQDYYGRDRQYTDYAAFDECIQKIANQHYQKVGFPFNIGCGLAGGDWNVIYDILRKYFENSETLCEIYKI